jgi:hypothetical protein
MVEMMRPAAACFPPFPPDSPLAATDVAVNCRDFIKKLPDTQDGASSKKASFGALIMSNSIEAFARIGNIAAQAAAI